MPRRIRAHASASISVLMCAALLPLTAGVAAGQAADGNAQPDYAAAKTAFKKGQALLQEGRFAEAIVEFNKAHEITGDGLVMGQVMLAYEKAGDFESALKALATYRTALPAADRASADELKTRYEGEVAAGRSKHLALPGEAAPPPPPPATAYGDATDTAADDTADSPPRRKRLWTWIALGTAGALGVSALVLGLNAKAKYDDLESTCKPNCHLTHQGDVDSVKTRAVVTDVLWGTAAAAAVAAGVLFFLEGRQGAAETGDADAPGEKKRKREDSEEEDDDLARRIRLGPIVGGGNLGVGASFRY